MDRMLKAIDGSIKHWEENCEKAIEGTLTESDIDAGSCDMCFESFMGRQEVPCDRCPLRWFGMWCNDPESPWWSVNSIMGHYLVVRSLSTAEACQDMLQSLVLVRLAYVDWFYGGDDGKAYEGKE